MEYRGKYGVCNVCPKSKSCISCHPNYRNDLNNGRSSGDGIDLIDLAAGVATGIAVGEVLEEVFDFFD